MDGITVENTKDAAVKLSNGEIVTLNGISSERVKKLIDFTHEGTEIRPVETSRGDIVSFDKIAEVL
jgi:hypothetical protein